MKKQNPRLSIVILNYNRVNDTMKTLTKLKALKLDRGRIEIIAIDNASTDGTVKFLLSQPHWVKKLFLKNNLGIQGLNIGFEKTFGDYILVLDDDSHPLDKKTVNLLIESLDRYEDAGVIACRIESDNGTPAKTWHLPKKDSFGESPAFVGCGFAIRRDLFKEIGWFSGHFFLYQNEIDAAIKIVKAGYRIYYEPRCRIVHRNSPGGRSSWRQVFYPTRNTVWLLRKYAPFPVSIYYIASRFCVGFFRAVQSGEYLWFLKAVKESLNCSIKKEPLSPVLYRRFLIFFQQSSLFHHIAMFFQSL